MCEIGSSEVLWPVRQQSRDSSNIAAFADVAENRRVSWAGPVHVKAAGISHSSTDRDIKDILYKWWELS